MELLKGAAVVCQSGGPTAAINSTLAGVITQALAVISEGSGITNIYGMRNGIEGLLRDDIYDLGTRFGGIDGTADLMTLMNTPAAALGSCRKKLPPPDSTKDEDKKFYDNLIEIFKKHDIRYFFYIGGNDSMDTVAKLTAYTEAHDYKMRVVGLPKTIDNDLCGTDHTPGFGSAAKYIATTMQEIIRDCAVYTTKAVTIVEIMGRDSGWLTVSAALPRVISGVSPDLVYLPERVFDIEKFYTDVAAELEKKPNVVVAVSEGIHYADGTYVGEGTQSGATDVFGHKYLAGTGKALELAIKNKLGCKVRSVELNISQRCAAHIASQTDLDESFRVGRAGVMAACVGQSGIMMSITRAEGNYEVSFEPHDIASIANKVKIVPDEFINDNANNVTDSALEYLKPLIQGEPQPIFKDGLPVHIIL